MSLAKKIISTVLAVSFMIPSSLLFVNAETNNENERCFYLDLNTMDDEWKQDAEEDGIRCHIYSIKDSSISTAWRSNIEICTIYDEVGGIIGYNLDDVAKRGFDFNVDENAVYGVIFSTSNGSETYPVTLSSNCFGKTLVGENSESLLSYGTSDSKKYDYYVYWNDDSCGCGPIKQITSSGVIEGTHNPYNVDDNILFARYFVKNCLESYDYDIVKNLVYGLDIDRNLVKDYGETLINNKFVSGEFNDYEYKLSMLRLSKNLQNVFDKITSEYTNYFYLPSDWKCSGKQNPIAVWTDGENYYNLTMQDTGYENIYGVEFPEEAETVVFTNGGFKDDRCETTRIRITDYESDNTIYILGYTTDMIYVLNSEKSTDKLKCVGDWYYLYDDGKYGFCSLREDAEKNNQVFAGEYQNEDNMSDVSYARLSKEIKQSLIEKFYTGADESSIDIKFIWDIGDSHRTYLFVHRFSGKKQSNIFLTEEFDDYSFTYPECREPMVMVDGELYRIVDAYKHIPFSDNEIVNLKFNLDAVAYINNRILGDVNRDDVLNINDATLLQKYLVGLDDIGNDFVCDVNDDLVVDIKDVTEMQKIIVGLA